MTLLQLFPFNYFIFNKKTASLSVLTLNEATLFTLLIMERWLIERTILI